MFRVDMTGKETGRLKVVKFSHMQKGRAMWECLCACGNTKIINGSSIRYGKVKSCGCYAAEQSAIRNRTHGESRHLGKYGTKEYNCWRSMIKRCDEKQSLKMKKSYFDRGITVCERWKNSYEDFLSDVGRCPNPKFSLDRINNNGNYEPGNVAWVSAQFQALNTRRKARWPKPWKWGPGATQWL